MSLTLYLRVKLQLALPGNRRDSQTLGSGRRRELVCYRFFEDAPVARAERVSSVDWWRGIALVTIFVNHIPGNPLEAVTHKNFGFSDASEGFVFLAGVAAAFAYLPLYLAGEGLRSTLKIVLRSFHLYLVHIAVLAMAGAIIVFTALHTDDIRIAEAMGFDTFMAAPGPALIGVVTLGHQPPFLNILPLYI